MAAVDVIRSAKRDLMQGSMGEKFVIRPGNMRPRIEQHV